ncbi:hypothetical protein B0F90DRAFT_1721360, partial [Multifurca ochricompacta]
MRVGHAHGHSTRFAGAPRNNNDHGSRITLPPSEPVICPIRVGNHASYADPYIHFQTTFTVIVV